MTWMDPDDTRVLDNVVRFIGQKVAAVVAETEAAAEEGCRRLKVDYEILPAVFDPAQAIAPGAPVIHADKTPATSRRQRRNATSSPKPMANSAMSPPRWPQAAVTYEGTFTTQRVQHAALETHGGLAWVDADGMLNVRSSTQMPFLTRRALADIFNLAPDKVRVFCERVGGGFGGKQEMFVEDILALAALKTGRPVKLELTREEQFISTSTRHPMRVTVKAGADKRRQADGAAARRALQHRRLWQPCRSGAVSRLRRMHRASIIARTRRSMRSSPIPTPCRPAPFAATACRRPCSRWKPRSTNWPGNSASSPFEIPPPQHHQTGRPDAVAAGIRTSRRALRQLRARSMPRSGRARDAGAERRRSSSPPTG